MPLLARRAVLSAAGFGAGLNAGGSYWLAALYGSGENELKAVALDAANDLYVTGTDGSYCYAAKLSAAGALEWQTLATAAASRGNAIALDTSGNVLVVGSYITTSVEWLVTKFSAAGALTWGFGLTGTATDPGDGCAVDSSGNVYGVGSLTTSSVSHMHVVKLNSSGAIQWQNDRWQGTYSTSLYAAALSADETSLWAAGRFGHTDGSTANLVLSKLSTSTGAQSAEYQYATGSGNALTGLGACLDPTGSYIYVGCQVSSTERAVLVKISTSGVVQWARKYTNGGGEFFNAVACDAGGNVYAAGYTATDGAVLCKYDSSGAIQWQRKFGARRFYGVAVSGSAVHVVGSVAVGPSGGVDAFVAKIPLDGSRTGTYDVGGVSMTYAAAGGTDAAETISSAAQASTNAGSTLTSTAKSTSSTGALSLAETSI